MRLGIDSFRGEVPRLTPRALPDNAAQLAINARLLSGDLEAWRQFLQIKALATAAPVQTIYLLNGAWLSWPVDVDVARGPVPGDTTFRTYLTAPGYYAEPRFTTYAMATTGAEPYPVATRPLGVPGPDEPPLLAIDPASAQESNIALVNPGAESGTTTGWTVDSGALVVYDNGDVPGLNAQAGTHFFGGGNASESEAYQSVDLESLGVIAGQGLRLAWFQARGANSSLATMALQFYSATSTLISEQQLDLAAPAAADTWERREMTVETPTGAVTARIVQRYELAGVGPTIDAYIDSITLSSVEYTNLFDGSSLTGWEISPANGTPGSSDQWRRVEIDGASGWAPPSFRIRGDEMTPWMHRAFATDRSPSVTVKFDFYSASGHHLLVLLYANDSGRGTAVLFSGGGVAINSCASWDDLGANVENLGGALPANTRYTVTLTTEQLSTSEARVTIRVVDTTTDLVAIDDFRTIIPIDGARVGFKGAPGTLETIWWVDNLFVTVSPPRVISGGDESATSYVYTFVNDLGEESGPSEPSETLRRLEGVTVDVTTPTALPSGLSDEYGIVAKRIYRAASGATGVIFRLVAEIPLSQETFSDALADNQLGEELESEGWDLPPSDLEGIRALPNGIMVGFRRNQLCFSVEGRPHAWPVRFRLPTDTRIVAIGNIDTTVVVVTESFVYTASGTSASSYTMSQPGAPQAGVSKRSLANLFGGVVFASPDGLMLAAGPTQVRNLTAGIFTREQWQALGPETMLGVVHDDVYFFFFDPPYGDPAAAPAGFMVDAKEGGFGVVRLSFHATAAHADPLTDSLHLVLDAVDEPAAPYLPQPSTEPTPDGSTIYQFDGDPANRMAYRWRGKLNLLPRPVCFQMCEILAAEFDNVVLRLYADGELLLERVLTSREEFTLPMVEDYREFEIEFVGTSRVRTAQVAEDVLELA
ncbi:MAG: hypothetical protein KF863_21390 [Rubrivivax sp.]|nr:hypothetical protein [Rubrivivax sp.]